ncbi:E3 ubiquitin-protein ligase RNF123-like [Frieseomelitta varia]|uniref:E3 ubiquitin-protein ligase RNF123-like n=1 Tax=Frieseomelitta varia TaxID=561572 RepID=UPI001CB6A29E|nr:E3 ubiquitin-protein ligase RNF123-like [Frieseomelitta varia]
MEIDEITKDIFGPDVLESTDERSSKKSKHSSRVAHTLELINKYIESTFSKDAPEINVKDNRIGRIGQNIVQFDMTARTGIVSISSDKLCVTSRSNFSTIRANTAVYQGKWMYEVQLKSKGLMQIGWSTINCKFTLESGVGDTIHSYAYDGDRIKKWNLSSYSYGEEWQLGDIIGCALDLDNGNVNFYRNGKHLGLAFENISRGVGFAYFPTVSLALSEILRANFGSTPIHHPLEGYEPLQAIPEQKIHQAVLLFKWFSKIIEQINTIQNTRQNVNKENISKEKLHDDSMKVQSYLMCLSNCILKRIGPLISIPYITEHIVISFIQCLSESGNSSLLTCLDLLWIFLEEHELKMCLEAIIIYSLSTDRHVSCLIEYFNQYKSLLLLTNICQHTSTRQYLLEHLFFTQVRLPNLMNIKPPNKKGLTDIISDIWWETNPVDLTVEVNKESYFKACQQIKTTISELEALQVKFLIILLDNSDGDETKPTSRTLFLRKFKQYFSRINSTLEPIVVDLTYRLLVALKILCDTEVGTSPVYVPCRVFYDGSIDYTRFERLGGLASHLSKKYKEDLIQLLGHEHEVITMEQAANSYSTTAVRINMNSNQGRSIALNATPLSMNTINSSLLELLDTIISFYNRVIKNSLVRAAQLRNNMLKYNSVSQNLKRQLEEIKRKEEFRSPSIEQELLRLINIFNAKLKNQGRYMAWIRTTIYSEEKQLHLTWLLKIVMLTLTNANLEGNMFSFVPEFYLQTLAELCVSLRNYMHPTTRIDKIPDYQEVFLNIANFLCHHFMDFRMVNVECQNMLLLMLAGFIFNPFTLEAMENVPEESRVKLVTNLVKSFGKRVWAESNWILVRFWQGNGFAFRYERSPHLRKRIKLRSVEQETMSQPRKPCPSAVYQGHLRDILVKNRQETTVFLNCIMNLLNWSFSEFIGMIQEIYNISSRPEKVYMQPKQLKVCVTCFDLTISLLRVLEMIITLVPDIFDNSQFFRENLLFRLCQLLCQVLNRISSYTSCFINVMLLEIPYLDEVDHFPILTAVIGVFLALLNEDMINYKLKTVTEVPKITQTLLLESNFQMSTLRFTLGDSTDEKKQKKIQFSFLDYTNDVTEEEIKKVKDMIEYLDECLAILPKPKISSDNTDICTICYAQPITVTFKPCNHQTCRTCIERHLLNSKSCFFCKKEILKVINSDDDVIHNFNDSDENMSS